MVENNPFSQFNRELAPLVEDMDQARDKGLINIEKYVKSGDGKTQVERLSANQVKLHDYDGTTKSGGIRVTNTSDSRYFLFQILSENMGYFEDAGFAGTVTGSDSTIQFVLGPNLKFEIDVDSEYDNLDVCYIEAAYLTGDLTPDGRLEVRGRSKDWSTKHDDEVFITFLGEVRVEQLPNYENTFATGSTGALLGIYNTVSANLDRFTGFDEGRDLARKNPYNTVKVRKNPLLPIPTLVREIAPGLPVDYGITLSEGATGDGPVTSLLPMDTPGEVYSVSQNIPSFLYPFTKEDGGRYTVMDLAESDAPSILSIQPLEAVAGNEIEKMGDIPYFRYWGDAVLMTPIVVSAVAVGVGIFFVGPVVAPAIGTSLKPLATNVIKIPAALLRGVANGTFGIIEAIKSIPDSVREGYQD